MVMENEERKIAKVYAIVSLYTISLLIGEILLGFALGRQSVMMSVREEIHIPAKQIVDTIQVRCQRPPKE